jgi:hypothetical protein
MFRWGPLGRATGYRMDAQFLRMCEHQTRIPSPHALHAHRGPRIKAAIISGACPVTVNPCTGLLVLKKKTEARLRNMVARVHPGTAWVHFLDPMHFNAAGVQCKPRNGADKPTDYMVAL